MKRSTDPEHQLVEATFDQLDFTIANDRRHFLLANYVAYTEVAERLQPETALYDAVSDTVALLKDDLEQRDVVAQSMESSKRIETKSTPGAAYVLIGSSFGKKVLQKRWATASALLDPTPQFLNDQAMLKLWPALLRQLDVLDEVDRDTDLIVDDAKETFLTFRRAYYTASNMLSRCQKKSLQ